MLQDAGVNVESGKTMAEHPLAHGERGSSIYGGWELTPLGDDNWRICDLTRRHADADCLIAYLDRTRNGLLHVLWLSAPCPTSTRFESFHVLFEALDLAYANASDRSKPPLSISHRPPLGAL